MPGEIAIYLHGAQGGVAADFARLYEVTNPLLLRYLRVTADGDHAELARTAWTAAVAQLATCAPDDDAWFELVVGCARAAVDAADGASSPSPTDEAAGPPDSSQAASSVADSAVADSAVAAPDAVTAAVVALRSCPPAEAEVLAMGVVANLGRESVARLTGLTPSAVLALVLQGQQRLEVSLEELIAVLRVPGTPIELADLPFAAALFSAGLPATPAPVPHAGAAGPLAVAGVAAAGTAAAPVRALPQPTVVDIQSLGSSAPAHAAIMGSGAPSRSVRVGAGAAAWLVALGGVGTAAAMSGLLSVAVDGILGGRDTPPLVTAEGPPTPGTPSTGQPTPGDTPSAGRTPTPTPTKRDTATPGPATRQGGSGTQPVVSQRRQRTGSLVVVASFDPPDRSTPTTPVGPTPPIDPTTPTDPTTPPDPTTPTDPTPTEPTTPTPSRPGGPIGRPPVPAGNGEGDGQGNGGPTGPTSPGRPTGNGNNGNGNDNGKGKGNGKGNSKGNGNGHTLRKHPPDARVDHPRSVGRPQTPVGRQLPGLPSQAKAARWATAVRWSAAVDMGRATLQRATSNRAGGAVTSARGPAKVLTTTPAKAATRTTTPAKAATRTTAQVKAQTRAQTKLQVKVKAQFTHHGKAKAKGSSNAHHAYAGKHRTPGPTTAAH